MLGRWLLVLDSQPDLGRFDEVLERDGARFVAQDVALAGGQRLPLLLGEGEGIEDTATQVDVLDSTAKGLRHVDEAGPLPRAEIASDLAEPQLAPGEIVAGDVEVGVGVGESLQCQIEGSSLKCLVNHDDEPAAGVAAREVGNRLPGATSKAHVAIAPGLVVPTRVGGEIVVEDEDVGAVEQGGRIFRGSLSRRVRRPRAKATLRKGLDGAPELRAVLRSVNGEPSPYLLYHSDVDGPLLGPGPVVVADHDAWSAVHHLIVQLTVTAVA